MNEVPIFIGSPLCYISTLISVFHFITLYAVLPIVEMSFVPSRRGRLHTENVVPDIS